MKAVLGVLISLFAGALALSCHECDGNPEFCGNRITRGWSASQVRDARCLVAYGDGNLFTRRLTNKGDCASSDIAEQFREEGKFNSINVHCCTENNCNLNWEMAGGPSTPKSTGAKSNSDSEAAGTGGGNGAGLAWLDLAAMLTACLGLLF